MPMARATEGCPSAGSVPAYCRAGSRTEGRSQEEGWPVPDPPLGHDDRSQSEFAVRAEQAIGDLALDAQN
jgi:hypothetical protein